MRPRGDNWLFYYLRLWLAYTKRSFATSFASRFGAVVFTFGKLLRFLFFIALVLVLLSQTKALAGYSRNEVLLFIVCFNLLDTLTQLLFREVYRFRPRVISGDFDLDLLKPMSPLFRCLAGGADGLDFLMLVPYTGLLLWLLFALQWRGENLLLFIILMVNGLVIAMAMHIMVLAVGVVSTEVDNLIMMYRDLTTLVRFPVDIYPSAIRGFLTYIIPVAIMMSFPPQALLGLLAAHSVLLALAIAIFLLFVSVWLWQRALYFYSSASS